MGVDFPATPAPGSILTSPDGKYQWVWDGKTWIGTGTAGGGGGASITVADTPPASPAPGALWWDSVHGELMIYYQDPNSSAWVAASNLAGSYLPINGGALTGPLTLAGNATANLQPVTLQQVTASLGGYLPLTGGTLTGTLNGTAAVLTGNLTVNGATALNGGVSANGGSFAINNAAGAVLYLAGNAGNARQLVVYTGASPVAAGQRWLWQFGNTAAETGGNAGSDFGLFRYNDAGTMIGAGVLGITRATGMIAMNYGLTVANANATNIAMSVANAGINYSALPNGGYPVGFTWTGSLCQLYVNNSLIGTLNVTSDARLKRNVKKAKEDALATLKKIALYSFDVNYRTHEDDPDVHVPIGFTAQQLREAGAPDAVHEGKAGTDKDETRLTLDLMPLLARCVRAIQQLSEKVEALEKEGKR